MKRELWAHVALILHVCPNALILFPDRIKGTKLFQSEADQLGFFCREHLVGRYISGNACKKCVQFDY